MAHPSQVLPAFPVDVVVVGAGIVGASIAYHLAERGLEVTVLDAGLPASGATGASFAWIGASGVPDIPSAPLRRIAVDEYRRLERELPEIDVAWMGALTWGLGSLPTGDGLDAAAVPSGGLDPAEVAALEPGLLGPRRGVKHSPTDGAVDPVATTEALVDAAVSRGARLYVGHPVVELLTEGAAVVGVRTPNGVVRARTVVLAAGVGTAALCAPLGMHVPVVSSPAVLVKLRSVRRLVRGIVASPDFEVRQDREGELLMPLAYRGERSHADLLRTARRAAERLRTEVDGARRATVSSVEIGWRPMPVDEEPIVGAVAARPGLYLSVMHSGITLAAAVGRLAATEIATGTEATELDGCRLDRFAADSIREPAVPRR